jgi:hypothetical protein
VSSDGELSTEDLARSGGVQQRGTAADERTFEHRSNVAAPGAVAEDEDVGAPSGEPPGAAPGGYVGAPRMQGAANAPMHGADAAQMTQDPGAAQMTQNPGAAARQDPGAARMQESGTAQMQGAGAGPIDRDGGMPPAPDGAGLGAGMALLDPAEGERFQQRWSDVQARFVDDPRGAVQTADGLVAELMQSLARGFSDHKARLESAWQSGSDPDTEELRQALQRYRSFFKRLLST